MSVQLKKLRNLSYKNDQIFNKHLFLRYSYTISGIKLIIIKISYFSLITRIYDRNACIHINTCFNACIHVLITES